MIVDSCMFYDDLAVYEGFGGIVLVKEEGENISRALGSKKNLILQNHGLITAGSTVGEAAAFFIALERACQTQLLVEHALTHTPGLQKKYVGDDEAAYTKNASRSPAATHMQFVPEYELICKETEGDFTK
ncbi:hypothetical protein I7I51_06388 [Histoplasma capsulatum]|uniref:Class II aldolase/adducin N-terminal domain-containing protein n=1 Tax=Ajellomyces capsulatus TaxID=5037 RepID=A0A8A1MLK0_AJECA|nr:hypothetical protein I7I51_06388 [Histoplasma capsulatum]